MLTFRTGVFVLVLLGCTSVGLGQPAGESQARQRAESRQEADIHPQRLRALLERRLEQVRTQEERLTAMLERLDAGESVAEILAELREQGEPAMIGDGPRERPREGAQGQGRAGQSPYEPMSPEEYRLWHGRILAFFNEHAPELADRLRQSGQSEEARRVVHRLRREVERLMDLHEQGSEEFAPSLVRLRTGLRISDVLGQVRQHATEGTLTADRLEGYRQELTVAVGRQFDSQLEVRAKLLERMGQRLHGARERLEAERAERSRRIEAEVSTMLDRATQPRDSHERGRPADRERRPK